jgi:hypothetical protein
MVIDEEMIARVATLANGKVIDDVLKDELKQAFPGIRFTLCSEDDINAGKPVLESQGFDIYLVGSSDHCLTLTNDYSLATGVVIAETYED